MRSRATLWIAVSLLASACSSSGIEAAGTADVADETIDGAVDAPGCCPISPGPTCSVLGGGSPDEAGRCGAHAVSDPPLDGWQKKVDEHGCPYWDIPVDGTGRCGGDAVAPDVRADTSDGPDLSGDDCPHACAVASSCGWAMPFGCGDWCGPSEFTTHLSCIAAAKSCAEACACMGWSGSSCPAPDAGADAASDTRD